MKGLGASTRPWDGGSLVTNDVLTVGNLASFVLYSAYVGIGLSGVSTFYGEVMKGLGASTRPWELTDRTPLIPPVGGIVPVNPKGQIRFENVSFAYPTRPDQDILKSLNLDIPPKTVVAIVGPSGSGKSTIGSLLLRLSLDIPPKTVVAIVGPSGSGKS